jgi:hypothetical protein
VNIQKVCIIKSIEYISENQNNREEEEEKGDVDIRSRSTKQGKCVCKKYGNGSVYSGTRETYDDDVCIGAQL